MNHRAWKRTVEPTVEPVTLAAAKVQVREETTASDSMIGALITAARQYVEDRCGIALIAQTWVLQMDRFPCDAEPIEVPRPPLLAVSAITYLDGAGAAQTWGASNYRLDTTSEPGRINLAAGALYPITQAVGGAVTVTYSAGFGPTAESVPMPIQQAMLLLVDHWYNNRSPQVVGTVVGQIGFTVDALLEPYKVWSFG